MSKAEKEVLRLQSIIDCSNLGTWEWNIQTGETVFNETWAQIIGYTLEELAPTSIKTWEALSHPGDLNKSGELLERHFTAEQPHYEIECRMKHKDGHWVWVRDRGKVTSWTNDGKPLMMYGSHIDISKRKLMELALHDSEEKQNTILSNISDVIGIIGLDGIMKYKSPNIEKWFGWKPQDLVGTDGWLTIHPDDLGRIQKEFHIILEKENAVTTVEYRYKCKDGDYKWVELTATNLTHDPVIGGVLLNYHDITKRRLAEATIREKDIQFQKLSKNVPNLIFQFTRRPDGTYFVPIASEGIKNIFGCTPEDVINDFGPISRVLYPDDAAMVIRDIEYSTEHLTYFTCEFRVQIPGREIQWIYSRSSPEKLPDGSVTWYGFNMDITERKLGEKALQERDEDLKEVQRIAHVGSWRLDISTNEVTWSEELYKMYGFDPSLPPPPYNEHRRIFTPESWDRLSKALPETIETGKPYELELETVRPDGSNGWMWVHGEVLLDKIGVTVGLRGAAHDITERKRASAVLRESEEKYRLLYTAMDQGLALHEIIIDENGKPVDYVFLDINDSYIRLLGITREMSIGKSIKEIMPDVEQYWIDIFGKVALTGESSYYENYLETTGRYYSTYSYCPKKNYFAVLVNDITEHKLAEEAIAAEREQLAVTLRSIGDGVITTDTLGNVVIMNKVAEELCGWKQDEAQGKPLVSVFNIINQSTREQHENPVEKVLATGQIIELANHTLLISRDGTERIIADSGAPIKDKESKTIGVVLVFRDMTEKHKLLDNMQRIDKLDSLGVLAGGIAHDFNNLLGGIFGYIDLALEHTTKDKPVSNYLDKAVGVLDRAKDLTQQLLTFSKGGAPKRKTGQIGKLVKENAAFVLSGSNVSCDYKIAQDLWLADYDENQIGQVIDNIVLNAQQAMPIGGVIGISVNNFSLKENDKQLLKAGNYIRISITDTGVGIPQDTIKQIFDPFFTTKHKGNGLGLATCYSIIRRHDGYIDVETIPGKGSTFHVYLPATIKGTLQDVSQTAMQHKGKGSILVMEDENFLREIVGRMLTDMGYTFIEAETGEEALQICAEAKMQGDPIRGALFDLTIPGGMGGREAIVKLRNDFPDMVVFAVSGFSENPIMARPTEFGFTDSIRKPFRKAELAELLNKYLKTGK